MKTLTQLAVVAVLAGAAAGGWYFRQQLPWIGGGTAVPPPAAQKPVPVELSKARRGEVIATIEAVGTARANEAVVITAKLTGLISKIAFQDGQKVKAGTVLVEFDANELQARLEEARATRDNARQLLARADQLLATKNVPAAKVDELKAQFEVAQARVRASEALLADYTVRAPFSGRLGLRQISLGALVKPGDVITTLDDASIIKVEFDVAETYLAAIKPGLSIVARSAAFPGREFSGKVGALDSRVDPATRSIRVHADIDNADEALKPGMFLTVILVAGRKSDAILVPEEAVVTNSLGSFVFTIRDGRAVRTPVSLGQRVKGAVEILDGVAAGTDIVVGGVQSVRDGAPVEAITPIRAAPAA